MKYMWIDSIKKQAISESLDKSRPAIQSFPEKLFFWGVVFVTVLGVTAFSFAWSNPSSSPPGGNISEPLNVSSTSQIKTGSLGIGSMSSVTSTAILQLDSTSKGFLLSRMTITQRNAIASPATGLLVYNITDNAVNGWDGSAWGEIGGGVGWAENGNDIYNSNSGSVGIGTGAITLNALLDVAGSLKIGNTADACGASAVSFRGLGAACVLLGLGGGVMRTGAAGVTNDRIAVYVLSWPGSSALTRQ